MVVRLHGLLNIKPKITNLDYFLNLLYRESHYHSFSTLRAASPDSSETPVKLE